MSSFSKLIRRFGSFGREWWQPRFIQRSASTIGTRKPRPTRLAIEALEDRMLMSSSSPSFSLIGQNLYNTSSATPLPIDTAVKSFASVNNEVFDLHVDGTLQEMSSDGSGKVSLNSN